MAGAGGHGVGLGPQGTANPKCIASNSVIGMRGMATHLYPLPLADVPFSSCFSHGFLSGCLICTFGLQSIRFGTDAGAYLVNVAVKQPSSHCRDPAVAERLWDETDRQIKAALARS